MTRALSYPAPCHLAVLSPTPSRREDLARGTIWTDAEVTWLLTNYGRLPARQCAQHLRRSYMSVRIKAHRMGLRRQTTGLTIKDIVSRLTVSRADGAAA